MLKFLKNPIDQETCIDSFDFNCYWVRINAIAAIELTQITRSGIIDNQDIKEPKLPKKFKSSGVLLTSWQNINIYAKIA